MSRQMTFAQAVNEALHVAMGHDASVICYGLGTPDPKGVFGTTLGLQDRFGPDRVFDMPTSENAMTGVAIGASLNGVRPVVTHQRLDFFLLAMDQLVNNAAKWHYMFGGHGSVPITIRLIMGRGWGQGPTHSQNLQAWFAHMPGLKVLMPTTPADAKGLLLSGIFDDNPVLVLEHRWLYNQLGDVPEGDHRVPIAQPARLREGDAVTIVAMSYMTVEALRVADHLAARAVHCDVIDLRTVNPLCLDAVYESVQKTGRLLCLDTGPATGSVSGEVIARVTMDRWADLKAPPRRVALPDLPTPTSPSLTRAFYPTAGTVLTQVGELVGCRVDADVFDKQRPGPHDVPGEWFTGPF